MRLCYCESPKQLIESVDYNLFCPAEEVLYLVRDNDTEVQKVQFKRILSDCENFLVINIPKKNNIKKLIMYPAFIAYILLKVFSTDSYVVGDARSYFSRAIFFISKMFRKKVVLVDDGLYLLSYWKNISRERYTVFTNLPLAELCKSSNLNILEKKVQKITAEGTFSCVFIGAKLVEIGFMSLDTYLSVLRILVNKSIEAKLVYYAHREENDEKLAYVEKLGFEIVRPELPVEEYLSRGDIYTGVYYSFYSTALFNLSRMVVGATFVAIKPSNELWPKKYLENIMACYELFEVSDSVIVMDLETL